MQAPRPQPLLVSLVMPVFNERENLPVLLARVSAAAQRAGVATELLFVDDGSSDGSAEWLREQAAVDPRLRPLILARNFGHQAALVAGLEHARGDAVITLDGDLQHPPELIPDLIERWRAGYDIVQTIRRVPVDRSHVKRATSRHFYRLLSSISQIRLTPGAADFRLMSRAAVDAFLSCYERCRFNRGLVHWIGFSQTEIVYDAAPRHAGESKYKLRHMLRLAGDAIFSFSSWPLRLAGWAGAFVSAAAMLYLVFVLWAALFTELTVPGWTSILATVLALGGVQLLVLWILGEYVGRLYEEVKRRPIYILKPDPPRLHTETVEAGSAASSRAAREDIAGPGSRAPLHDHA